MEKLGIEPILLLTQVINFTILVVLLTKFLYKPILKMLEERKKKIEEGLALTEKMKLKEEELKKEREKVIDKAREEGQGIIEESKQHAKKLEEDLIARANEEARLIKEKAKNDFEDEKVGIIKELNQKAVKIAISMVRSIIPEIVDKKSQLDIVERKLASLEKEKNHGSKKQ